MDYLIGDTIQLRATIKNFAGVESEPANLPTVSVFDLDGKELESSGVSTLTTGTTGQYYYDWKVSTGLTFNTNLIAVWSWDTDVPNVHKKKMTFSVVTVLS
ncbi:unnamed protein product [marine sediment metagenome]|uniref:Uncharacterized protein n=1 Tax=marine sediment metagenome TaxID=412755 RepID=X1KB54_9ZZZZ